MKLKYTYIHFEEYPDDEWVCWNNNCKDILGQVRYYSRWRQYVIEFEEVCVFNSRCLRDVADFLEQLNKGRVEKGKKERSK